MSIKPIPALEAYRVEILKDALKLYSTSNNLLEQLILATSMQRSGYNSPKLPLPKFKELVYTTEHSNLAFFTADMLGYFEGGTKNSYLLSSKKGFILIAIAQLTMMLYWWNTWFGKSKNSVIN